LIDDDSVILRLLEVNFHLAGFTTMASVRGDDAVAQAAASPPDAVVSDIMMPGIDGYDVCETLRRVPGLETIPFVFLSARAEEGARGRGAGLSNVEYVTKPFDAEDLVATVRGLIEGAGA
jgi:Response regulators consisting of a CheY-like receiver domain and a winged-helix DNA-binding domain